MRLNYFARYGYALGSPIPEGDHYGTHGEFTLKCPHVELKKIPSSSLEVTWSHNNQQQVTVTHGVPYINPKLPISSIQSKKFKNKTILHVGIDDDHREFHYNELKEKFSFRVGRLRSQDVGVWECKIVVDENGRKKAYTSRKQAKVHKTSNLRSPSAPPRTPKTKEPSTPLAKDQERSIEISRQFHSKDSNIVFSRLDSELHNDRKNSSSRRMLIDRSSDGRKRHLLTRRVGVIDRIQRFVKFVLEARGSSLITGYSVPILVSCLLYYNL
ncbi:hypothetical protein QR680_005132 [Steinernema hermaphroditum]|uniref:Uncharacterized protein n=1 Tax=Steinernema hermaphroditum TaxID=289476 RepID=A0AA39HT91_9BILA|nr:hypothetical protein QR680_005132 [Steinernema hermaphroditum]